jgi:hypothetical protein
MKQNQRLIFLMVGGDVFSQRRFCNELDQGEAEKVPLKRKGYFENASPLYRGVQ